MAPIDRPRSSVFFLLIATGARALQPPMALESVGGHSAERGRSKVNDCMATLCGPPRTVQMSAASVALTVPEVTKPNALGVLKRLSTAYSRISSEYYLAVAYAQAACLASAADIGTQSLEGHPLQLAHVAAMALVAASMSGAANAIWLRQLEAAFPGKGTMPVVAKTMIHAVILASIINSAYLVGVPLLTAYGDLGVLPDVLHHPATLLDGWELDEFITLTKLELCMFGTHAGA